MNDEQRKDWFNRVRDAQHNFCVDAEVFSDLVASVIQNAGTVESMTEEDLDKWYHSVINAQDWLARELAVLVKISDDLAAAISDAANVKLE